MILTADWHLTDQPADEYRWRAFEWLIQLIHATKQDRVVIAGDLTDRKDRHSAALVNRLIDNLTDVAGAVGGRLDILMGNHDQPLKGDPFWKFLSNFPRIHFYDRPSGIADEGLLFLPYSDNPKEAWAKIRWQDWRCIIMHQPVDGALGEDGFKLSVDNMPVMPRLIPIYSGDIHTPQLVGRVQYIGAPHPVKFGNDYECRFLVVDDETYKITRTEPLSPMRKLMVDISDVEELGTLEVDAGDQMRVRFHLPINRMADWPVDKQVIQAWARELGVILVSCEALIVASPDDVRDPDGGMAAPDLFSSPGAILKAFCEDAGVDGPMLTTGQDILAETLDLLAAK